MTHRNDTESVTPQAIYAPWHPFGGVAVLKGWIEELKACQASDVTQDDWRLTGRAVMVTHPDKDQQEALVAQVASEAGWHMVEITEDEFVQWVINNNVPIDRCPALVYVPQGAWSAKCGKDMASSEDVQAFRKALPAYLGQIDPRLPLVFVTSGNSYANLDPILRTPGVFDRRFDAPELSHEALGALFLGEIGLNLCDASLTGEMAKVGRLIQVEFNERRRYRLIALSMQRLARKIRRKLSFDDLVLFGVFGGGESDADQEISPEVLHRVAIHETGHALVAILDSQGANMPDYVGIVGRGDFHGQVTESYAFDRARYRHYTFKDSCHKIRIALAGRVAESVVLGAENVSTFGARVDLVNATNWAADLMGKCGFAQDYSQNNPHSLNLAVFDEAPSDLQAANIEKQVRGFLSTQYDVVEKLIRGNMDLFEAIKTKLLEKRILNQSSLSEICQGYLYDADGEVFRERLIGRIV